VANQENSTAEEDRARLSCHSVGDESEREGFPPPVSPGQVLVNRRTEGAGNRPKKQKVVIWVPLWDLMGGGGGWRPAGGREEALGKPCWSNSFKARIISHSSLLMVLSGSTMDPETALEVLKGAPEPQRGTALATLHTLLQNLALHPEEDKYHRIRLTNAVCLHLDQLQLVRPQIVNHTSQTLRPRFLSGATASLPRPPIPSEALVYDHRVLTTSRVQAIQQKVLSVPGGLELLRAVGFEEQVRYLHALNDAYHGRNHT
jgi:hypothetical protein